jgi:hypothetical protein
MAADGSDGGGGRQHLGLIFRPEAIRISARGAFVGCGWAALPGLTAILGFGTGSGVSEGYQEGGELIWRPDYGRICCVIRARGC